MKKFLFLLLLPACLFAQAEFRIYPSSVTQTEPSLAVHPENPDILFAGSVTLNLQNGFKSEGVYVSTDGGITWRGSDTAKGQNLQNHGGDPGTMITPSGRLVLTHIGNITPGLYSHYSTDLGSTWSNQYVISPQQTEDKGSSTIDNSPSSPYYGRLYASWVNIATPFPVLFSYSSNEGTSWQTQKIINAGNTRRSSGGYIKTARDGKIYVTWGVMSAQAPFNEDSIGFAFSTDGGAIWTVKQNLFDMNGIAGTLPSKNNIRVNGLPQIEVDKTTGSRSGWLYIITNEKGLAPAGSDPDIILRRSSDGGTSWSNAIRVNQDPLNNGKIQFFPVMEIDAAGGINILFYDDRFTASDSSEIMLARSTDGGDTWTESVVSTHRFKPKPILGSPSTYQGDHIALQYANKKLYAMWMDDFSGIYQIWCKIIPLNINNISDEINTPAEFTLNQNYPNPFNPETQISFTVNKTAPAVLKVYDALGSLTAGLFNGIAEQGKLYKLNFNASHLSSGIYYYQLVSGSNIQTKKLVLIK